MGLRLRKSFPLGRFLRLNLSKSGVSVGLGPPGLNVNIGPRGVRQTVGIPGTGISYQETTGWRRSSEPGTGSGGERRGFGPAALLVLAVLGVVAAVAFTGGNTRPEPGSPPVAPQKAEVVPAPRAQPAPPVDRALTREEMRELQGLLRAQGFDPGPADGVVGPRTRKAAEAFARAHHLTIATPSSLHLLKSVQAAAGKEGKNAR